MRKLIKFGKKKIVKEYIKNGGYFIFYIINIFVYMKVQDVALPVYLITD